MIRYHQKKLCLVFILLLCTDSVFSCLSAVFWSSISFCLSPVYWHSVSCLTAIVDGFHTRSCSIGHVHSDLCILMRDITICWYYSIPVPTISALWSYYCFFSALNVYCAFFCQVPSVQGFFKPLETSRRCLWHVPEMVCTRITISVKLFLSLLFWPGTNDAGRICLWH